MRQRRQELLGCAGDERRAGRWVWKAEVALWWRAPDSWAQRERETSGRRKHELKGGACLRYERVREKSGVRSERAHLKTSSLSRSPGALAQRSFRSFRFALARTLATYAPPAAALACRRTALGLT